MTKIFGNLFILFLLLLQLGCDKDTPEVIQNPYIVNATIEDFADGIEIKWNRAQGSDFVKYQVWGAGGDSIPDNISTLTSNMGKFFLVEAKTDINDTVFKTQYPTFPPVELNNYRIEAIFKSSKPVLSKNLFLPKPKSMYDAAVSIQSDKAANEIYLLTYNGDTIQIFDAKNEFFKTPIGFKKENEPYFPDFTPKLEVNTKNGKKEAYVIHNSYVKIIDLKIGKEISTIKFSMDKDEEVTNETFNDNGILYLSTNQNNFIVIDINTKIVDKSKGLTSKSFYNYYVIPDENNLLAVETTSPPYNISVLKLDVGKKKIESIEKTITVSSPDLSFPMASNVILTKNAFLIGRNGVIYDTQLNKIAENNVLNWEISAQSLGENNYVLLSSTNITKLKLPKTVVISKEIVKFRTLYCYPIDPNWYWVVTNNPGKRRTYMYKVKL